MTRAGIVGMALWAPDTVRRNSAWPDTFIDDFRKQSEARRDRDFTHIEQESASRPFSELYTKHARPHESDPFKGALERRVAPAELPSAECDVRAASGALIDARIDPEDVDVVLSSALVPDRVIPSNGPHIQHRLGCVKAAGIGVEGACSSAL